MNIEEIVQSEFSTMLERLEEMGIYRKEYLDDKQSHVLNILHKCIFSAIYQAGKSEGSYEYR